ncbi:MAG: RagB/SusD family nutrient uptake outer membrane protein [Prevotella sp.]|nr:RagB/SusD family nutrient uptake outer membrane protein [Prevotella sp.]
MKKLYIIALLGTAFGLTACEDKLDIAQKASLTTETFYQSDADAEKALASAYEAFQINTLGRTTVDSDAPGIFTPAKVMANHPGDDVNYGGSMYGDHEFGGSIDEFRYLHTPTAIKYHYSGLYLSIYPDNLVIEYFGNKEDATPFQKQAVAEARVLRAYNYFLLACYWGTPPFVDHLLSADVIPVRSDDPEAPENAPKSQQAYFTWVGDECLAAVDDLSERASTADKEGTYRITKGFAWAMAGKAYMFAGDFAKAKDCLKKVIDSGKYALVSGDEWTDLFHIPGDGCPEKVFEVNVRYNPAADQWTSGSGNGWGQHGIWMETQCFQIRTGYFKKPPLPAYTGGTEGWGSIGLPEWYADAFVANDGRDSKRLKATMINIEDMIYGTTGDERIDNYYAKLKNIPTKRADLVKWNKIGISNLAGHYGQSFWIPMKHVVRIDDISESGKISGDYGDNWRLNNVIVMRYAEVLLNYVECCIRTGDTATAGTYLKMIQERAGSQTVTSGSPTIIDLKKEKSFELWFEGCRYQDVMRWSKLDNDSYDQECLAHLKVQGKNIPHLVDRVFRTDPNEPIEDQVNGDKAVWQHSADGSDPEDRFYLLHTHEAESKGFEVGWQPKHRLFPYPQNVKDMNPNLKQDGWDD